MPKRKSKKVFVRLEINHDGKSELKRLNKRFGMTQTNVATRALEWFVRQNPTTQAQVLGFYPSGSDKVDADIAPLLLRALKRL